MARGRALRASGVKGDKVDTVRFAEVKAGKLEMPKQPASMYQLFGGTYDAAANTITGIAPAHRGLHLRRDGRVRPASRKSHRKTACGSCTRARRRRTSCFRRRCDADDASDGRSAREPFADALRQARRDLRRAHRRLQSAPLRHRVRGAHALRRARRPGWVDDRRAARAGRDGPSRSGLGFLSQNWKFTAPVYIGDTITAEAEVLSVHADEAGDPAPLRRHAPDRGDGARRGGVVLHDDGAERRRRGCG